MARACAAHHLLVDAITHRRRERHRARPLPKDHHTRLPLNHSARLRFQRRRRQLDRRCRRHSRGRARDWHVILWRPVLRRSGIGARRRGALVYSAIRCGGRWRHRAGCARELRLQLLHLQSNRAQSRSARSGAYRPGVPGGRRRVSRSQGSRGCMRTGHREGLRRLRLLTRRCPWAAGAIVV